MGATPRTPLGSQSTRHTRAPDAAGLDLTGQGRDTSCAAGLSSPWTATPTRLPPASRAGPTPAPAALRGAEAVGGSIPRSTARLCPKHGIVTNGCPCTRAGWATRAPDSWKGGSTRRWRKTRAAKLAANPLCEWPGCEALATAVDHADGTDYNTQRYDWDMLRSLCEPHHATRTAAQGNAAQRARRPASTHTNRQG